jgi:hypothetical protein
MLSSGIMPPDVGEFSQRFHRQGCCLHRRSLDIVTNPHQFKRLSRLPNIAKIAQLQDFKETSSKISKLTVDLQGAVGDDGESRAGGQGATVLVPLYPGLRSPGCLAGQRRHGVQG